MTSDDVIRMAREAGLLPVDIGPTTETRHMRSKKDSLERFAALVAAAEREACAKVCESTPWSADIDWWRQATKREVGEKSAFECAAAIRARSKT